MIIISISESFFFLQKILQLLPERIQSRWQFHSIGSSHKTTLNPSLETHVTLDFIRVCSRSVRPSKLRVVESGLTSFGLCGHSHDRLFHVMSETNQHLNFAKRRMYSIVQCNCCRPLILHLFYISGGVVKLFHWHNKGSKWQMVFYRGLYEFFFTNTKVCKISF